MDKIRRLLCHTDADWVILICEHCDAQMAATPNENRAIEHWNFRPIEDDLRERIKELKELVEEIENKLIIDNFKNLEESNNYTKKIQNILGKEGE